MIDPFHWKDIEAAQVPCAVTMGSTRHVARFRPGVPAAGAPSDDGIVKAGPASEPMKKRRNHWRVGIDILAGRGNTNQWTATLSQKGSTIAVELPAPPLAVLLKRQRGARRFRGEMSLKSLRIGTWNLGRSGAFHRTRIPRQLEVLRQFDADLWVLTEAHDANLPPDGHACKSMPGAEFHQLGEHRVIVWSRYALDAVATEDAASTVAVRLQLPGLERPLLVYGTVMTHAKGGALQRQALAWQRHQAAVQRQCAEWLRLRQEFPEYLLCVAGDFNASLDASARYGTVDPRRSILQGLADAGMKCLTTDERRGPSAPQGRRTGMDHVAFPEVDGLASRLETVPGFIDGHRLSDRDGILAELAWP